MLVTGILGILCCGLLAPYTWIKSNQAIQSIQSGYGNMADLSTYNITKILGIVGSVLWILSIVVQIGAFILGVSGAARRPSSTTTSISIPPSPN